MTPKAKPRILFIYRIVLSALLFISAVCFIGGACYIYSSTDKNPYTYESIGRTFSYIAAPVLLTLVAVIAGGVLHLVFPTSPDNIRAARDKRVTLRALRARLNLCELGDSYKAPILREARLRRILFIVNMALYAVALTISLVYTFLPSSFTGDYNSSVVAMAYVLIASFILPVALHILRVFIDERSLDRELDLAKAATVAMKEKGIAPAEGDDTCAVLATLRANEQRINLYTKIGVLVLAVAFIVVGVVGGGMVDVLAKAIKICTECIGLG